MRTLPCVAAVVAGLGMAAMTGCRKPAVQPAPGRTDVQPAAAVRFVELADRAAALGVEATYDNGGGAAQNTILESLGGGVGWLDFDRDGWLDLLVPGGGGFAVDPSGAFAPGIDGRACTLFRSGKGSRFTEVAAVAGIESDALYTHGVAVGDYNADGFPDVLVTGYGVPQLWHNQGDGTFAATEPPGDGRDGRWSSSAGWADFDGDGLLDLYLARYVDWSFAKHPFCSDPEGGRDICPPRSFEGLADSVYRNDGDGRFTDRSTEAGLRPDGKGLGVLLADLDLDGDVDVYVANDTVDNFLYVNDGRGVFTEQGLVAGVAYDDKGVPNGSMGVDCCDYNRDGLPDIWVANFERESFALYRNEGRCQFLHVSRRFGINDLGGLFVGFGTSCPDLDADGWIDIVVSNGHVINKPVLTPRRQQPLVLRYDGQRFRRQRGRDGSYFAAEHEGRGLACGDYDRDGDIDVAVSHIRDPLAILENGYEQAHPGIVVELVGTRSNRDAVGARVRLEGEGIVTQATQVTGGGSYLSHSDRALHLVPVPADGKTAPAGPPTLVVTWPAGHEETIALAAGVRRVRIVEGSGHGRAAAVAEAGP